MRTYRYQNLWNSCMGAWCPSKGNSRSDTLLDHSGYGNHGTLTGMDPGTDWLTADYGMALDFDGSNDRVTTNAKLSTTSFGKQTYSLTGWFRPRTLSSFGMIISIGSVFEIRHDGGGFPNFAVEAFSTADTSAAFPLNRWTFIAGVCDGSTLFLYVNGLPRGTPAAVTHSTRTNLTLAIGGRSAGSSVVNGLVDDLRYYSRALGANEVQLLSTRRGIAYDLKHYRRGRVGSGASPSSNSGRNLLVGCGL